MTRFPNIVYKCKNKIIWTLTCAIFHLFSLVSAVDGDGVCFVCPKNMFCVNNSIINCPANSESPINSKSYLNCTCIDGYEAPTGGTCTACLPGYFKKQYNDSCIPCPTGTSSDYGSTTCSCKEGYGFDINGNCHECAAGRYKSYIGNFECLPCPVAKYTDMQGSTNCLLCQTNTTTSDIGQDSALDCKCGAGYGYMKTTASCASCGIYSYKADISNEECMKKNGTGSFVRLILDIPGVEFTESARQFLVTAISEILMINVSLVEILAIHDTTPSTTSRRLLQEESNLAVELFINDCTADIRLLNQTNINRLLAEMYASEASTPPYVRLDTIFQNEICSTTELRETTPPQTHSTTELRETTPLQTHPTTELRETTPPQTHPRSLHASTPLPGTTPLTVEVIVGIVLGSLFGASIVIILIWYQCKGPKDKKLAQQLNFAPPTAIPELDNRTSKHRFDVSSFFHVSRRSNCSHHV